MARTDLKAKASSDKKKIIHIELEEPLNTRFDIVKEHLGLKNDAEIVRFLLTDYYNHHLQKESQGKKGSAQQLYNKEINPLLDNFMKNYGDQMRRLGEDD